MTRSSSTGEPGIRNVSLRKDVPYQVPVKWTREEIVYWLAVVYAVEVEYASETEYYAASAMRAVVGRDNDAMARTEERCSRRMRDEDHQAWDRRAYGTIAALLREAARL